MATGSHDTTVRIWNVETGNELIMLDKPNTYVWDVKFTPDGTMLFAADGEFETSVIHVWRADSRQ